MHLMLMTDLLITTQRHMQNRDLLYLEVKGQNSPDTASSPCLHYPPRLDASCLSSVQQPQLFLQPSHRMDPLSPCRRLYFVSCFLSSFRWRSKSCRGVSRARTFQSVCEQVLTMRWAALQRPLPRDRDSGLPSVLKCQASGSGPSCLSARPGAFSLGEILLSLKALIPKDLSSPRR